MAKFLDLPVELRQIIYTFLVFSVPQKAEARQLIEATDPSLDRYGYAGSTPEQCHHQIQLCNHQMREEFRDVIKMLVKTKQVGYRLKLAFREHAPEPHDREVFTWIRLPTLQPIIDSIRIIYCYEVNKDWEQKLKNRNSFYPARTFDALGKEGIKTLFRHLRELVRLFQRTLKNRQGSAYAQVFIKRVFIDFRVRVPLELSNGTFKSIPLRASHTLYQPMKDTLVYLLKKELYKFPTIKRSEILPLMPTFGKLKLTYDRVKVRDHNVTLLDGIPRRVSHDPVFRPETCFAAVLYDGEERQEEEVLCEGG